MNRPPILEIVPTRRTRAVADRMLEMASRESGADVVLACWSDLDRGQVPALVALLLDQASARRRRPARPRIPLQLTQEERLRGYSQYRQGVRTEFAVLAYREYQRVARRTERARREEIA